MNDIDLITKVATLPLNLKEEVSKYIDLLLNRNSDHLDKKPLKFGMMKGTFDMADDFNEALDMIDARLIEERRSEDSSPFDDFVRQLKNEEKLD